VNTAIPDSIRRIYHKNSKQFMSVLRATTCITSQYELIPEIVEIFDDDALRFLEIFGGQVISIPPFAEIITQMRRVAIWMALKPLAESKRGEAATAMVTTFGVYKKKILETFSSMDSLMDSLGFELETEGQDG
jgi:hypothetical protein